MYWWRKEKKNLKEAAKETPNKYFASDEVTKYQYILYPELETRDLYREWHREREFFKKASDRHLPLSHIIEDPRDVTGSFRMYLLPHPQDVVVGK
ncbi:hypothetical protein PC116_g19603 [Phytophthora cactorum]|uniref:Uncharacterized protein n=1 Tax=Phytophthora cactorum TaxID=29920 RepID=A0A8T1CJP7_9STRA|nr:hypothetical protein PC113_g15501 [Phytophthora cactorum]KAG2898744.1 hypothetical protein PC114_g14165 [Phytophthora cactorum]KAG2904355.1 hypothetical protein PC115_g15010 [Phytophthora cactorum]KAG2922189.1 hypothetical protein PC117_g16026 [Phytophthora cactorum]KAG2986442.1 hypothetical protein PC119_g19901 [Phytophthora cactorum]